MRGRTYTVLYARFKLLGDVYILYRRESTAPSDEMPIRLRKRWLERLDELVMTRKVLDDQPQDSSPRQKIQGRSSPESIGTQAKKLSRKATRAQSIA